MSAIERTSGGRRTYSNAVDSDRDQVTRTRNHDALRHERWQQVRHSRELGEERKVLRLREVERGGNARVEREAHRRLTEHLELATGRVELLDGGNHLLAREQLLADRGDERRQVVVPEDDARVASLLRVRAEGRRELAVARERNDVRLLLGGRERGSELAARSGAHTSALARSLDYAPGRCSATRRQS